MKEKVILISIDGMRPDGFLQCGHPFVKQMLEQFSFCFVGLSNILDSELCRRKPAEGSHR